jgi:uncharacterized protein (TIRG00374 family)
MLAIDALVSVALIIGVLYYIGADKIVAEFAHIDYFYLLISIVFLMFMHFAMTYRIKILLEECGVKTKFREIFFSHMCGMLLSDFTPARSGYFATVAALRYNHGVPSDKAMMAILGPQALDFLAKVIAGTTAILYITFYVLKIDDVKYIFLSAFLMLVMVAVMVLLLFSKRFLALFSFANKIPLTRRIYGMFDKMQDHSHIVIRKLPHLLVLLAISWSAKAISWYFVAKSLGINLTLPFPEIVFYYFIQPAITILEFIPSPTIAGLGLSEGGGVLLFSVFGVSAAKAASFVFLARIKTTFVSLIGVPETLKVAKSLKSDFLDNGTH